jgi:hypothetical protein
MFQPDAAPGFNSNPPEKKARAKKVIARAPKAAPAETSEKIVARSKGISEKLSTIRDKAVTGPKDRNAMLNVRYGRRNPSKEAILTPEKENEIEQGITEALEKEISEQRRESNKIIAESEAISKKIRSRGKKTTDEQIAHVEKLAQDFTQAARIAEFNEKLAEPLEEVAKIYQKKPRHKDADTFDQIREDIHADFEGTRELLRKSKNEEPAEEPAPVETEPRPRTQNYRPSPSQKFHSRWDAPTEKTSTDEDPPIPAFLLKQQEEMPEISRKPGRVRRFFKWFLG